MNKFFPIENSRSAGKLVLDNILTEGKYTLVGFTGLMQNGSPENVFSKKIYVKKIIIPPVLAFAFNKEVPFTNNLAERDIRPAKVKQKISNCFRTFTGAEIYARIEGFVSTARKHNQNVFSELCTTFEGHNFIIVEIPC